MSEAILKVTELFKDYNLSNGLFSAGKSPGIPAIDHVGFEIFPGEFIGLIGESGSGKTTIGRAIAKLTPFQGGEIELFGNNITHASERAFKPLRKNLQIIFQDLDAALNPNMKIRQIMSDIFRLHFAKNEISSMLEKYLKDVNLDPAILEKYPGELSGGQKRRVAIANTLASRPRLIIADEPTTGLDNYNQNLVMQLIKNLQSTHQISMLLISHDLQVIKDSCQRVIVLYLGRIVESAPIDAIVKRPAHPYSQLLWSTYSGTRQKLTVGNNRKHNVRSGLFDFERPLHGCRFAPRCPKYLAEGKPDICRQPQSTPELKPLAEDHLVACHFTGPSL